MDNNQIIESINLYQNTLQSFDELNSKIRDLIVCDSLYFDTLHKMTSNLTSLQNLILNRQTELSEIACEKNLSNQLNNENFLINAQNKMSENYEQNPNNVLPSTQNQFNNENVSTNAQSLKDIVGLTTTKKLLRDAVLLPIKCPHLFTNGRKRYNSILLYGPPGTGKTSIVNGLAEESNVQFYNFSSADLLSAFFGDSEKIIKDLFGQIIANNEETIIFFDEIDSLCRKRTANEDENTRRVKTQLLIQFEKINNSKTFLICATNCPWDLDLAFIRRFQKRIYVPIPKRECRQQLIQLRLQNVQIDLSSEDMDNILNSTEGFTGADLDNLMNCVLHEPLNDLMDNTLWVCTKDGMYMACPRNTPEAFNCNFSDLPAWKIAVRNPNMKDFTIALAVTKKSVSSELIAQYEKYSH